MKEEEELTFRVEFMLTTKENVILCLISQGMIESLFTLPGLRAVAKSLGDKMLEGTTEIKNSLDSAMKEELTLAEAIIALEDGKQIQEFGWADEYFIYKGKRGQFLCESGELYYFGRANQPFQIRKKQEG